MVCGNLMMNRRKHVEEEPNEFEGGEEGKV
jgi:hypothetical protein